MDIVEYKNIVDFLKFGVIPTSLEGSHARFGFKRKCKPYEFDTESATLFYISRTKDGLIKRKAKCLQSSKETWSAFLEVHNPEINNHPGLNRTLQKVSQHFYWPGMTYDITNWIHSCDICLRSKDSEKNRHSKLKQLKVTEPWEIITMDIIGPVSVTNEGYKYIFTATDFYSKWVEAFPICNKYPAEVAACLKLLFYRHGACRSLLCNECTEFVSEVNEELKKQLGIENNIRAVYHPNIKTLDEKTSTEMRRCFLDLVAKHSIDWPHYIDGTLFSMRTQKNPTTKFTPFYLIHKREARVIPMTTKAGTAVIHSDYNLNEIDPPNYENLTATNHLCKTRCHQMVVNNVVQSNHCQLLQNAFESANEVEPSFEIGEKVLLSNQRKRSAEEIVQEPTFTGPYVIADIQHNKVRLMSVSDFTQTKILQSLDKVVRYREALKINMLE